LLSNPRKSFVSIATVALGAYVRHSSVARLPLFVRVTALLYSLIVTMQLEDLFVPIIVYDLFTLQRDDL
jgi:hypothetical protein